MPTTLPKMAVPPPHESLRLHLDSGLEPTSDEPLATLQDGWSNFLKEYWPDINRAIFRNKY